MHLYGYWCLSCIGIYRSFMSAESHTLLLQFLSLRTRRVPAKMVICVHHNFSVILNYELFLSFLAFNVTSKPWNISPSKVIKKYEAVPTVSKFCKNHSWAYSCSAKSSKHDYQSDSVCAVEYSLATAFVTVLWRFSIYTKVSKSSLQNWILINNNLSIKTSRLEWSIKYGK